MARNEWLRDALVDAIEECDTDLLRAQLLQFVPASSHKALSAAGIPDEFVFPTPAILQAKPTLLAYYRLLLGQPQKSFYASGTGMGAFKSMERSNIATPRQVDRLSELCAAMAAAFESLVEEMSPNLTQRDVSELPILTLGQQFQGGYNNLIGQRATEGVYLAVREIAEAYIAEQKERRFVVESDGGPRIAVDLTHDPDIVIREIVDEKFRNRIVIEIKGGTDRSNQHNRIGEAEKSHQKAKDQGFRECWTLIRTSTLDLETARLESPSTDKWFDIAAVLARQGEGYQSFRHQIELALGVPVSK